MTERDVVLGGAGKLDKHIAAAVEILDADAFFILTGCTAGIIGDDVESVAKKYRALGHKVYAVNSSGFLGDGALGYEIAMRALIDNIIEPNPAGKNPRLVNLLGIMPYHDPYWEGNLEEITRLLNAVGLEVNTFFSHGQGIKDIERASSAAFNIVLSPWLLKSASEEFEKRFGIPTLRFEGAPLGALDTAEFLSAVGEKAGLSDAAQKVIESEEEYFYRYLETGIGVQNWRRFSIVGESQNVVPITRFLADEYGFTPEAAVITDSVFRPADRERIDRRLKELRYGSPPDVFYTGDQWEINGILGKYPEAVLVIGSTNEREFAMKHGMQFFVATYPNTERLIYNRSCAGYRGALTLIEDIYSNL
jgi:nitrogenase molybdenum-iron protein beta chain